MSYIRCKITPKGRKEFDLLGIRSVNWGARRDPAPDNRVGRNGHDLGEIIIVRDKSLNGNGLDNDSIQQASQLGDKAMCKGWITVARAANENEVVQRLAWDEGHICGIQTSVHDESILETVTLCVTSLKVDNSTFQAGTGK